MSAAAEFDLVTNRWGDHSVEAQIRSLFDGDGTIYLITGFFTANAFRVLRPDIESFLARDPTNELVIVITPSADQFTASIAKALERLDGDDRVRLYKYPEGFLHAKLYVRDGPEPAVIIGSANLTRVAFGQNLELNVHIDGRERADEIEPFLEWIDALLEVCVPIRRRDLLRPVMVANTVQNWANKGRLIPTGTIVKQPSFYVFLALIFGYLYVI